MSTNTEWTLVGYQRDDEWIEIKHVELPYEVTLQWDRGECNWHASLSYHPKTTRPSNVAWMRYYDSIIHVPLDDVYKWATGHMQRHVDEINCKE